VFQSTTFALPKVLTERVSELSISATRAGWYAFIVFSIAAGGQLVVGTLVDRYPVKTVFAVVAALQALLFAIMIPLKMMCCLGASFKVNGAAGRMRSGIW